MDRVPKPAPFPVGIRLRYIGTRCTYQLIRVGRVGEGSEEKRVPLMEPGLEVVIAETRPGRRGTLRHLRDEDGPMFYEDTGEPILDETRDGYSVYYAGGDKTGGRCIFADDPEWERV